MYSFRFIIFHLTRTVNLIIFILKVISLGFVFSFFPGKCEKHVCRESHYCLNSESTICDVMPHYCIDKSLVCDGLPNCSEDDYSDEEKCKHTILWIFLQIVMLKKM